MIARNIFPEHSSTSYHSRVIELLAEQKRRYLNERKLENQEIVIVIGF